MKTPARGGAAERGLTVVELMFLVAISSVAMFSFARFIIATRQASARQEAGAEMLQTSLRMATNLRSGLQTCAALITNYGDGTGNAMLSLHNLVQASVAASSAPGPVSFTSWPTATLYSYVDMSGPADVNAGTWGDELMYVAQLNPITFTALYSSNSFGGPWHCGTASGNTINAEVVNIQRVQFVYDYLTWNTSTAIAGKGVGLRIVEWRSQPYIVSSSLSSFADLSTTSCCPRLSYAMAYLTNTGYTLGFNPSDSTGGASACFFPITPSGAAAVTPGNIPMYSWAYLDDYDSLQSFGAVPNVNLGHVSTAYGHSGGQTAVASSYSIAYDTMSPGGVSSPSPIVTLQGPGALLQVPKYAALRPVYPQYPAGFEVAIDGVVGSREIFVRTVMMAANAGTTSFGTFQGYELTSEISVAPSADF